MYAVKYCNQFKLITRDAMTTIFHSILQGQHYSPIWDSAISEIVSNVCVGFITLLFEKPSKSVLCCFVGMNKQQLLTQIGSKAKKLSTTSIIMQHVCAMSKEFAAISYHREWEGGGQCGGSVWNEWGSLIERAGSRPSRVCKKKGTSVAMEEEAHKQKEREWEKKLITIASALLLHHFSVQHRCNKHWCWSVNPSTEALPCLCWQCLAPFSCPAQHQCLLGCLLLCW